MNVIKKEKITPAMYEQLEKDEHLKYELIDGIICMSPSPSMEHQRIARKFVISLSEKLNKLDCEVFFELDVRINENIFKPDVMVFCRQNYEVPELVIEVLSASTAKRDMGIKVAKYEEAGIKEYWIADPKSLTVIVHDFVNETVTLFSKEEMTESKLYPDYNVPVQDFFSRL